MKAFGFAILFCLVAAVCSQAQPAVPAENGSTNELSVELGLFGSTDPLHAPADVRLFARVTSTLPGKMGEKVQVDFFDSTNLIGSAESVWNPGIHPDPNSRRPQPMIVSLPGFSPVVLVWSNVTAGTFALTARAARDNGDTAVSPPLSVTVLP